MGSLVLFSTIVLVLFSSSYGEDTQFAGLMNLTDRIIVDGFGVCSVLCSAPTLHTQVNKTLFGCQYTMTDLKTETERLGSQPSGPKFYNFAIKTDRPYTSMMCRWTTSILSSCVSFLSWNHCEYIEFNHEMGRITKQLKAYVCSLDPAVMECALHPEIMNTAGRSCAATHFEKYFDGSAQSQEEHLEQFQRFYDGEIKTNNAESQYSAFKTLGTCVSDKIGMSSVPGTNCSKVQDLLDAEIDNIIDYFKETDMLKCSLNPELWRRLGECGQTFANSLKAAILDPKVQDDPMVHVVEIVKLFVKDNYQLLNDPLKTFMTCTLHSIKDLCGKKWTYNVVHKQLTLLENLFNPKDKTLPDYCKALVQIPTSAAGTSKMVVVLHVAAAVLLRILTIS